MMRSAASTDSEYVAGRTCSTTAAADRDRQAFGFPLVSLTAYQNVAVGDLSVAVSIAFVASARRGTGTRRQCRPVRTPRSACARSSSTARPGSQPRRSELPEQLAAKRRPGNPEIVIGRVLEADLDGAGEGRFRVALDAGNMRVAGKEVLPTSLLS